MYNRPRANASITFTRFLVWGLFLTTTVSSANYTFYHKRKYPGSEEAAKVILWSVGLRPTTGI